MWPLREELADPDLSSHECLIVPLRFGVADLGRCRRSLLRGRPTDPTVYFSGVLFSNW